MSKKILRSRLRVAHKAAELLRLSPDSPMGHLPLLVLWLNEKQVAHNQYQGSSVYVLAGPFRYHLLPALSFETMCFI